MLKTNKKNGILLFIAVVMLGTMALTACSGSAVIDVNVDPNTGQGNIVVNSDQPSDGDGEIDVDINDDGNQDMSQILLFGIVVALLLGTVAIVVSTSRRDRA